MKKVFRRALSFFMAMTILLCCSSVQALAADIEDNSNPTKTALELCDESFSFTEREQIQQDIASFQANCILPDDFGEIVAVEKETISAGLMYIVYSIKYGDIINEIYISDRVDNQISYHIKQGDIQNDLTISVDGIYLNDSLVEISTSTEEQALSVTPRSSDRSFQEVCPYGVASDYTKSAGSEEVADIMFNSSMKDLTVGAFIGLVGLALGSLASYAWSTVCNFVYLWLNDNYPYAKGLSYQAKLFHHKSCGALSGGHIADYYNKAVTKYVMIWFPERNYEGDGMCTTVYEIYTIY